MEKKPKIIVIEDDKDINKLIVYNLQREGFEVSAVYDGLEAKSKLMSEYFDVVILDIMLPGIDGFDICKEIKGDPGAFKTFVVMLTAKSATQDKIYAHFLGADCYITKPFNILRLIKTVKELAVMRQRDYVVRENKTISHQGGEKLNIVAG